MSANVHSGDYAVRGYTGFKGTVSEAASASTPAWPTPTQPPAEAPNIIIMLMDDMGFSDISPFGSEVDTPALEELARTGYRLNNYQTPPMCAPARAALLTGMNPHRAGFAWVPHIDPGFPNTAMEIPHNVPTLAESLRENGYSTFMVGKWHLTLESKMHDGAEKSSWPLQRGFDHYYGCMDGFTSLFHPHRLIRDNTQVTVDEFPEDYYLTDDLTNQAIDMIKGLRSNDQNRPFFLYFAHQAVHGPLQAKEQDIEKYRGMYDSGWDHIRSERFARQIAAGLFPEDTTCAPRNSEPGTEVVPWDSLTAEQQQLFARYMEVYAASIDNMDQNLQRLTDYLKETGQYENTIIVFTSDNGGTSEGGELGTRSYFSRWTAQRTALPADWDTDVARDPELIGSPQVFAHYPRGWAYASNTPFRQYKLFPHHGGTRVPLIISWPQGLPRENADHGVREQFTYVSDIGETLMQLAGVQRSTARQGHTAPEIDGVDFSGFLRDPAAVSAHTEQYVEINGRRAMLDGRYKAIAPEANGPRWKDQRWELYDVLADPTETTDISSQHPQLTAQLAEKWQRTAWQNQVFPLNDDGSFGKDRPSSELPLEAPVTLYPGTPTLERFRSAKLTRLRSFVIEIDFAHDPLNEGVLVAHGDQGGGYLIYVKDNELVLSYNEYGRMHQLRLPLAAGPSHAVIDFRAEKGLQWDINMSCGSVEVPPLRVRQLTGMCPLTGISIGLDRGGPVDWELSRQHGSFNYTGHLRHVRYVPGEKAPENPEVIRQLDEAVVAMFE